MKNTIDLSVVILNFNTKDLTRQCLLSIGKSRLGRYRTEIIVCDNASSDGSETMVKKEFPHVTYIQNNGNLGFAAGNNPGIRASRGRYVLLLNSDTEVEEKTFAAMISFMDKHPKAGSATCRLMLPDGNMDPACHRGIPTPWAAFTYLSKLEKIFPKTRVFGEYHEGYKNMSVPHEVDCISGAFFMVRREVVDAVGPLDESYFMYAEDIDWCYRIKKAGWQIWFNPDTSILHKKKQSGRSHANRDRRIVTHSYFLFYNRLFYTKHFKDRYPGIVTWLVYRVFDIELWLLKTFGVGI